LAKSGGIKGRSFRLFAPYFGHDPDSELAGRLRASQIAAIAKTTPLMMLANILCATLTYLAFRDVQGSGFLVYWVITLYLVSCMGVYSTYENSKKGHRYTVSRSSYARASRGVAIIALLWAVMIILIYPKLAPDYHAVAIAVMCGMLGGGAMSVYFIPRVLFVWVGIVTAGCGMALYLEGGFASHVVLAMLAVYSISLMRAGHTMAKTFAESAISGFELTSQSETIGLLLKDFSENASDWLWEINATGQVSRGSEEFKEALKVNFSSITPGEHAGNMVGDNNQVLNMRSLDVLRKSYNNHESFSEIILSSSGSEGNKWVSLSGKPLYNQEEQYMGFRGVASDITEKKLTEERIGYLAHNDALTGLVNRSNYTKALQELIDSSSADKQWSIFYMDLDGFKAVNDTYGHATGDKLLGAVAKVLKEVVAEQDTLARLGGDEFAILCRSAGTPHSTSMLAEAILQAMSKPFIIDDIEVEIGVSIGIALRSCDGSDANTLMHNADLALYRAKEEGRCTFRLYEHQMDDIVKERRTLEADLRSALKNDELSLCYQPLIAARETKTVSFEALVRWMHPVQGPISPTDFIPIAEKVSVISDIGDWVIHRACMEAKTWPSEISVAVNLSPQQFQSNRIIDTVISALSKSGLEPHRLEVEITEGLFMDNTEEVLFALRELKGMGVSISLDDFGTGYSSLSYLLKFPFDKLKIDRSLIHSIDDDPNAKNVLEAITKLASVMNLTVTAEGIETLDQVRVMLGMHCTHFQGFLFGKPLDQESLHKYIANEFSSYKREEVRIRDKANVA